MAHDRFTESNQLLARGVTEHGQWCLVLYSNMVLRIEFLFIYFKLELLTILASELLLPLTEPSKHCP